MVSALRFGVGDWLLRRLPPMRLIPVIDLLDGVVVRGVGGERNLYQPIASVLCDSAEPLVVARAFRDRLGLSELYIADLDAIEGRTANCDVAALAADGFRPMVDAGVRCARDGQCALDGGAAGIVAGLETLDGPAAVGELVQRFGSDRVVFSLDLQDGRLLARGDGWPDSAEAVAAVVVDCGVRRMIVLDLAGVGGDAGVSTLQLCQSIHRRSIQSTVAAFATKMMCLAWPTRASTRRLSPQHSTTAA